MKQIKQRSPEGTVFSGSVMVTYNRRVILYKAMWIDDCACLQFNAKYALKMRMVDFVCRLND